MLLRLQTLLSSLQSSRRTAPSHAPRQRRGRCSAPECLEARIAPAAVAGVGGADADNFAVASSALVAAPDLHLTSGADHRQIIRGQTLHTTYSYSNDGNQNAFNATIVATVPVGTHFNGLESNVNWSQIDARHYEFDIASLPAGAAPGTVVFAVDVNRTRVAGLHEVDSTATLDVQSANGPDPTPANNVAAASTTIYEGIYAVSLGATPKGKFTEPLVSVFDPVDGHQLYQFDAYEKTYRSAVRIAVADINGDGFDDIITTVGKGTGRLRVFDGLTGTWFHDEASYTGPFNDEIAVFGKKGKGGYVAAGDLTGDGHADIAIGAGDKSGKVVIYDGLHGTAITFGTASLFQPFKHFKGGLRLAIGDVLGDGTNDLLVGMATKGAEVKVYDGSTLFEVRPPSATIVPALDFKIGGKHDKRGVFLSAADVDGALDGKADIIVGRNSGKPSEVEIYSGTPPQSLVDPTAIGTTIIPFGAAYKLGARVGAIDINFDGIADIITAPGGNANGAVSIYSGADHSLLLRIFSPFPITNALYVAGTIKTPVVFPF